MAIGYCPKCGCRIHLGEMPARGSRIKCKSCGANLEIVGIEQKPLAGKRKRGR
jgi:lysine biosynthesis protein LysW